MAKTGGFWILLVFTNFHRATKMDTRIVRHAVQFNDSNPVVIVSSDTDILVLLIYIIDIDRYQAQIKIDDEKFVDINDICIHLSEKVTKPCQFTTVSQSRTQIRIQVKPFKKAPKKG